jgi:hypothetical protein
MKIFVLITHSRISNVLKTIYNIYQKFKVSFRKSIEKSPKDLYVNSPVFHAAGCKSKTERNLERVE